LLRPRKSASTRGCSTRREPWARARVNDPRCVYYRSLLSLSEAIKSGRSGECRRPGAKTEASAPADRKRLATAIKRHSLRRIVGLRQDHDAQDAARVFSPRTGLLGQGAVPAVIHARVNFSARASPVLPECRFSRRPKRRSNLTYGDFREIWCRKRGSNSRPPHTN
jgi:hypothetical protein